MMKKLLSGFAMASLLLTYSACDDSFDPTSDQEGRIVLDLTVNHRIAAPANAPGDASNAPSRASAGEITVNDLRLCLRPTSTNGTERVWNSLADFDPSENFSVGNYEFIASYGTEGAEGFELPYYYGSTKISIRENETTPVSLTASLANAMVSVVYTENFKNYFTKYATEVQTSKNNRLTCEADEERPVYVSPGHLEVVANVTKPNGLSASLAAASFNAEARHHYVVTLDVDAGSAGTLVVTFDSDTENETIDLDISDQILLSPAPEIAAEGFTAGESIKIVEGSTLNEKVRMIVTAYGQVASGILTSESEALYTKLWPATLDFASADATQLAIVSNLGLKEAGLSTANKTQMALLDFTQLIPNIPYVEGGNNTSTFTLVAKDQYSKVSEPLTLTVEVEKLAMSILSTDPLYYDQAELLFTLAYNGNDIENKLKASIKNDRGTFDAATINSITKLDDGNYKVAIAIPVSDSDVTFKCSAGSLQTPEVKAERAQGNQRISVNDSEVFATHATAHLSFIDDTDPATKIGSAKFLLAKANGDFQQVSPTISGATAQFSGLTPGANYTLKVLIDNMGCTPATFTTEAATQLPDSGFDNWSAEKKGDYQYLWSIGNGNTWASLNALTTSTSGSGSGSAFALGGCAYRATSGTIPANSRSTASQNSGGIVGTTKSGDGNTTGNASLHSDKQHSGANAALVRTVGWGSGNSAKAGTSKNAGFNTCDNTTAGELFLGKYENDAPVYGIAFASRPSAISFYYHYDVVNAGNGDYATAEISVFDNSGNEIASASTNLEEKAAYTQVTLNLNYGNTAAKAAKISVNFKSSANSAALEKNTNFWTTPGGSNTSGGEYIGSELYIDDIQLIY